MKTLLPILVVCFLYFALLGHLTEAESDVKNSNGNEKAKATGRGGRLLPIFQIVRFPVSVTNILPHWKKCDWLFFNFQNDICSATSRNGTCYTAEECAGRGGTNGGSCAAGFGVCCLFTLACGGSTNDNVSYLVQAAATTVSSPCDYTVCPVSTNICRIRYDFTTMVLGPQTHGVATTYTNDNAIGTCQIDSFEITAPGSVGSPVICGTNTGYHSKPIGKIPDLNFALFLIFYSDFGCVQFPVPGSQLCHWPSHNNNQILGHQSHPVRLWRLGQGWSSGLFAIFHRSLWSHFQLCLSHNSHFGPCCHYPSAQPALWALLPTWTELLLHLLFSCHHCRSSILFSVHLHTCYYCHERYWNILYYWLHHCKTHSIFKTYSVIIISVWFRFCYLSDEKKTFFNSILSINWWENTLIFFFKP